jgi:hypothetical protein
VYVQWLLREMRATGARPIKGFTEVKVCSLCVPWMEALATLVC